MDENQKHAARQAVISKMTAMAADHANTVYTSDGKPFFERDSDQLFALLTDVAYAYVASLEWETDDPGPGQALFVKSGMSPLQAMLSGIQKNLADETMKPADPFSLPINGWAFWRMKDGDSEGDSSEEK